MLEMVDIEYIRKKHLVEGWSIRKISRNLGVSRQSGKRIIRACMETTLELWDNSLNQSL